MYIDIFLYYKLQFNKINYYNFKIYNYLVYTKNGFKIKIKKIYNKYRRAKAKLNK